MNAYLVLENGKTFMGEFFGKPADVTGEIVFTTGMNGFMETVTDPSHYGQIVLQTFPLIGNSGVISTDLESDAVSVKAYICKYLCQEPSNFRSEGDLDTFFIQKGITGVKGIDTRELTKIIRDHGTICGKITSALPTSADQQETKTYNVQNAIAAVSCKTPSVLGNGTHKIALLDLGVKKSIVDALVERGCQVHIFPHNATVNEIMEIEPDGVLISDGPGNPEAEENKEIVQTIKNLVTMFKVFGIGMGHLLLAMAHGHKVEKLKHGHYGANQPVKDVKTGRLYITNQSHSYTVVMQKNGTFDIEKTSATFVNVNDGTCEGLQYYDLSYSVSFCPATGPKDTQFLFDRFIERLV